MKRFSRRWQREVVTIGPGAVYVAEGEELIETLLGSCVSACMRDTRLGIGGMNHVMVPIDRAQSANARLAATAYGAYAMEVLINRLLSGGAHREDLEVKLFGGGRMLQGLTDIGRQNIEFAHHYLRVEGLRLVGEDVGGTWPRKIVFQPRSGRVKVRRLHSRIEGIVAEETTAPAPDSAAGSVELF